MLKNQKMMVKNFSVGLFRFFGDEDKDVKSFVKKKHIPIDNRHKI